MNRSSEKILCETPTPGKKGVRIPKWKYDLLRESIRKVVPANAEGVAWKELPVLIKKTLTMSLQKEIGSISWHTVTVKLHLECLGEIERVPGAKSQRIWLVA